MTKKNEFEIQSSAIEYLTYIAKSAGFIESDINITIKNFLKVQNELQSDIHGQTAAKKYLNDKYQTVRYFRTVHYQSDFDKLMNTKGHKKS